VAATPPVGSLFAAFLGYNPIASILGPTGALDAISASNKAALTGKDFFPQLISQPFHSGLVIVFIAAAIMSVIGALASVFMGGKYVHVDTAAVQTQGVTSQIADGASDSENDDDADELTAADALSDV
jgi:hypothetical protein